ncbi:unnamed protein product, partial [Mycena citricolor]
RLPILLCSLAHRSKSHTPFTTWRKCLLVSPTASACTKSRRANICARGRPLSKFTCTCYLAEQMETTPPLVETVRRILSLSLSAALYLRISSCLSAAADTSGNLPQKRTGSAHISSWRRSSSLALEHLLLHYPVHYSVRTT